jgi:hypothetical protein
VIIKYRVFAFENMQQMNAQWVITSIAKELSGYELLRNQQDNKHPDYVIELWKEHMLR